jgi:hypothetical protein
MVNVASRFASPDSGLEAVAIKGDLLDGDSGREIGISIDSLMVNSTTAILL